MMRRIRYDVMVCHGLAISHCPLSDSLLWPALQPSRSVLCNARHQQTPCYDRVFRLKVRIKPLVSFEPFSRQCWLTYLRALFRTSFRTSAVSHTSSASFVCSPSPPTPRPASFLSPLSLFTCSLQWTGFCYPQTLLPHQIHALSLETRRP